MWFLLILALVFGEDVVEHVVPLTTANFDQFIKNNKRVLVEFYAPWCGHCKRLAPEYEDAAKELSETVETKLVKVDATAEKALATRYKVQGYPTLKYFSGDINKPAEYGGGRTKDSIVSWILKRELPALTVLASLEEIEAFKKKGDAVLLAYTADESSKNAIQKAADDLRDHVIIGFVNNPDLVSDSVFPSLVFYTNFDDTPVVKTGEVTLENIVNFFNEERFPPIGEIGPDNYQVYMDRKLPLAWIALKPNQEENKEIIKRLSPFAQSRKGKLSFVWVDADKFAGHVENLGIPVPGFMVIDGEENTKFLYEGDIKDDEDLQTFWKKYDAGILGQHLKSQAPLEHPYEEGVLVLVGSTFPKHTFQEDKAVFVKFYAPWCGHCKKMAPDWIKLAANLSEREDIVIAKIDSTENDSPETIQGFPTLILYPKDCTSVSCGERYTGARDLKEMTKWMEEKVPAAREEREKTEL